MRFNGEGSNLSNETPRAPGVWLQAFLGHGGGRSPKERKRREVETEGCGDREAVVDIIERKYARRFRKCHTGDGVKDKAKKFVEN